MKKILTQIGLAILAVAAIVVIKLLDLPGIISAILVIAILIGMMIVIAGGMAGKGTTTENSSSDKP